MSPILPGEVVGVIGGGQLARMLALEGRRMGYRLAVLDPDKDAPGVQFADIHIAGETGDLEAARRLAAMSRVVTVESDHVPADLLAGIEDTTFVRPRASVLRTIQDRLEQRHFIAGIDLDQPTYAPVGTEAEVETAGQTVGFPAVLKTRREGYDGKGQAKVGSVDELRAAWHDLDRAPCVLERFVPFDQEVSVVLARGVDGSLQAYPVAANVHRHHILHTTQVPASIAPAIATRAIGAAERVATALDHVGVLAVEFFVMGQDLLINEVAPRTHNSGHFTLGGAATSQFEQHIRAVCGRPLGDPSLLRPAVMINLLGDLWLGDELPWQALTEWPDTRLHFYGKSMARPGRKMGHLLILRDSMEEAMETARQIERRLWPDFNADPSPAVE